MFQIKATGLTITSEVQEYLEKKISSLQKLLPKNDSTVKIQIELGRTTRHHASGNIFRAEINIYFGKDNLRAVSEREDLFTAIDDIKEEAEKEIDKFKGRRMSLLRRGGAKIKEIIRMIYKR